LRAVSQFQTGQTEPAIQILDENGLTWQLEFLRAIFEKNAGRDRQALDSFLRLNKFNAEIDEVFGFYAASAENQIIDLYLKAGKTRAALDLAKNAETLKAAQKVNFNPDGEFKFKTLEIRRRENEFVETRRALERLSTAAESIGDFPQAVEFEKAKSGFLTAPEKESSAARLEMLRQKQTEQTTKRAETLVFNEK
jgi:tetratricopeptide (TPR) repeat protein